jgi:hypothetical protein
MRHAAAGIRSRSRRPRVGLNTLTHHRSPPSSWHVHHKDSLTDGCNWRVRPMARPAAHVARRPWEPLRVVGATTSEEAEAASANPQVHSRGAPARIAYGGIPRLSRGRSLSSRARLLLTLQSFPRGKTLTTDRLTSQSKSN